MKALIFDVDGTLAETEDLHRQAFNAAFAEAGLDWHWDDALNRELLAVSGGIERMGFFQESLPEAARLGATALGRVYEGKRGHYARMLAGGALGLRPGVADLIRAARDAGIGRAVVTAASAESFNALAQGCLPGPVSGLFDLVITGSDVSAKKPDPEGYRLALAGLGIAAEEALVFEDSPVGYAAAVAAGIPVVVTPSAHSPQGMAYPAAVAVLPSLERDHWPSFGFPPAD
ncbi:HAD-IA family hydrolase [Tropicimonas sediminicola]|uniref:Haloacid dehalogenase superfamily, subfamily IA, variant 3 with third motif having DD or ED n=1 Tax=Tropicimonas sediminicola TaxID=1031541 RepID=A0A239CU97_9RHOB|nr:HAD-IA family hydrolase [Tropicimonas sediminicola]SNS23358.1 haloacid dehalogenase superfamily, subfamily IA, variant 3 with third motif having DD or ED [Tropicimonas sediminicola]